MAVGFRSLAGFPLGAGTTGGAAAPTCGFTSLFWWMGGVGGTAPLPTVIEDGVYRGKKRKVKKLASPPPLLVPALPNDDDEVLVRVLDLFMRDYNVH